MSCFGGRMQEYDRVSLDRFDGKNLQSTVYFLSHLHEDHTAGLGEKIFLKRLKSNKDIFLYCSEVTQVLLVASKKYHRLKPYIRGLSINTPTTIVIPDPLYEEKEKITVTLLPAFHCPGSVMFLIEGKEGTVLYTGDFRWEHFNIEQMHHLRSGESVKKIKSLYIDTTFCSPENLHIPSRQQCIDAVCQLVQEWTSISPKHVVKICLRAQYGHEPLLNAVASRLNKKIHVNAHKVSVYNRIQEFHGNFTTDGINTQLHACDKDCMIEVDGEEMLCREAHDADKVLAILPTTMYFTQFQHLTLDKIVIKINSNFFRACYSFHSSYTEVKDLLSYLKPERVYPNVKTPSDSSLAVTQHRLNTMLKECLESGAGEVIQPEEVKELGTLKTRSGRQVKKRKGRESTSDADSLDFGTPVKTARYSLSCSLESGEPASPSGSSSAGTRKGRGRGRGRGKAETASQPVIGTRRSTRRSAATPTLEETTLKKSKKSDRSPTPDLFLTPASDTSEQHSSFCGSERSDSELSLFSSQKSLDLAASGEAANSWTAGSFLAAVSSSSEDDTTAGRHCLLDDEEQTDEQFQDCSQFSDTEEEEEGLKLEQLDSVGPPDNLNEGADNTITTGAVKSKSTTKSPVKRGKRGKKGKGTTKSTLGREDAVCSELNTEQNVGDNKGFESDEKADLQISAESGNNQFEVSDTVVKEKDKNSLLPDAVVTNIDTGKLVSETDGDIKGINTDKMDAVVESKNDNNAVLRFDSFEGTLNSEAIAEIDSRSENNSDEPVKDENVLKYLGTPIKTAEESTSSAFETNSKRDVETKENTTGDIKAMDEENVDNVHESSQDLHLHLSETTHGSEENSNDSNMSSKNDKGSEIVIIDSDSVDEIDGVKQDTSTEVSENDRNLKSRISVETVSCLNGSSSEIAVMVVDSDSNEVANNDLNNVYNEKEDSNNITSVKEKQKDNIGCVTDAEISVNQEGCSFEQEKEIHSKEKDAATYRDDPKVEEHKAPRFDGLEQDLSNSDKGSTKYEPIKCTGEEKHTGKENVKNGTDCIKLVDEDQVEEAVQIVSVESTKSEISSKQIVDMNDSITSPDVDLTENKLLSEDDDVIEIVDLTGNEMTGQLENQDTSKAGKKTIKISLLTKTETIRKVKKTTEDKSDVFEREKTEDTDNDNESDLDDINEISSSPEWLSTKKASGQNKRYRAGKEKKTKTSTLNKSKNSDNKIREVKDNELNESASDIDKSVELSEKELYERAEVRRQAVGFICDTDSESDTDESSDPGSPEADMLYDDYVELSSDSDNEGGIGGKRKGEKAPGRKSKNFRRKSDAGNGSNGKSGNTTQGWLTSRKHTDLIESAVQGTVTDIANLETMEDIQMAEQTVTEIQQGPYVSEVHESGMDTNQTDQAIVQDVNVPDKETPVQTGEGNDQVNFEEKNDKTKQGLVQTQIDSDTYAEASQENRLTENSDTEIPQEPPVSKPDNLRLNTNPNNTTSNQDSGLQTIESDKIVETAQEPPKMETGNSTNQSDKALDKESVSKQVTTGETIEEVEGRKNVSNVQELTVVAVYKSTLKTGKNSDERDEGKGNCSASDEGCIKTGEKNNLTENVNRETVIELQQLVPTETSKESIPDSSTMNLDAHVLGFVPRQLKKVQGEKKVLQSDKEEKKGTDKVTTEQNSDKAEKKSDLGKTSSIEPSRETYEGFLNKKVAVSASVSASLESNKSTDESKKLLKSKKIIDWRKLPPANVSKVSDKITSSDQPVPPGSVSASLESNKSTAESKKLLKSKKNIDWRKLPPANVSKVSDKITSSDQPVPPGSVSATLESNKAADENNKLPESKKIVDWRKLTPTNVSKVSDKITSSDQPAPPGTEDPPSLKEESKQISSVISTSRPIKTYLYKTIAPVMPLPATAVQRPLYNLLVAGAAPTHIPPPGIGPPYNYKYTKSALPQHIPDYPPPQVPNYPPPQVPNYPPPQIPSYAPPGWVQYPYRPPPSVPFPLPTAFTQPPPSLPYSKVVPTAAVSMPTTFVTTTAKLPTKPMVSLPVKVAQVSTTVKLTTNPRMSSPITVASTVQSVNTTVYKAQYSVANVTQSTAPKWSASSITEPTRAVTVTCAKSKKLAPWQQKKVDIFDRGPSCIAKKEVKPKININIGKTPSQKRKQDTPPISEERSHNQETSVDDLTRLSQQGFQQRPASMDLAAIKANISALTGLPVANTANTANTTPSVPANVEENQPEDEDLPALVEKLKRLEEVQAILEAVNTPQPAYESIRKETTSAPKETFQYGHSQHEGYNDPIKEEYYDSRGTKRDRLSIDDEYESGKRRRSYEYEGREREDDGRYRSRDYTDYEGRERSYADYDRRDYEKRERNVDYERRDRDYLEYRERERDITYERRSRDYVDYGRDRNLDYERREREFERRYREEQEYRRWVEERRRKEESYRGGRRVSPSRYPDDDRRYDDPYYDRPPPPRPREARYEEWLETRHTETHSRGRLDSYERYDDQPTPRPRSHSVYEDKPTFPQGQPEASVDWNTYDSNDLGRHEYGTEMSTHQEGLTEARTVKRPPYTDSARNPQWDPFKKKPIMARVLSRSGQVLSVQSGWQSGQQTATVPDVKQEDTDLPVFLTGMKYFGTPTDTTS